MQFFIVLLAGTTIASFLMDVKNTLKLMKGISDAGYKFNISRLKEINGLVDENIKKANKLTRFIPIYNVYVSLIRTKEMNEKASFLVKQLEIMGAVEEMDEAEKTIYELRPNVLTSITIAGMSDEETENEELENLKKLKETLVQSKERSKTREELEELKKLKEALIQRREEIEKEEKAKEEGPTLEKKR